MKILVLSWRDPKHPLAGGAEQVMHEHMKGWVNAGHEVTLFASSFKGGMKEEVIDGVKIIRKGKQIFGVHVAAYFYYVFEKHERFDLAVDQFHGIPFFTPLYMRIPKLAVVQEVTGRVWLKNELPRPFNWMVGWIGYLGDPLLYLFYRRVVFMTGSESAKRELIRMGIKKTRIKIVPHGVIVKRPKILPKKENIGTVMFLGAVTKDKGIFDAFEVFRLLAKSGKYNYWVVGKAGGTYVVELGRIEQKLGKTFKYWGFVDLEKKFDLLARAHVLINPSILEGFGLVNIEANAVGTPVVAYKSQGLVDSVKEGVSGIFCDENTPKEMARTIKELLNNSQKMKNLSKSAMDWSGEFSWEKSRRLSLELIDSLVSR